jgi:urease accessory protein
MNATLLLLADGRFPAGGYAHSGGMESAVEYARVADFDSLRSFLLGRLATAGLTAAAFAAVTCAGDEDWHGLDAEVDARTPSPAQRRASRSQGRQLLRTAIDVWPSQRLEMLRDDSHHSVALGAVAWSARCEPLDAALVAAQSSVSGPASAAVRLLGLDPVRVTRVLAELARNVDAVATRAMAYVGASLWELPCLSAPRLDIDAELHASWEVRLFAS